LQTEYEEHVKAVEQQDTEEKEKDMYFAELETEWQEKAIAMEVQTGPYTDNINSLATDCIYFSRHLGLDETIWRFRQSVGALAMRQCRLITYRKG